MTPEEFAQSAPGLANIRHVDRIKHFAWFILNEEKRERFQPSDIRNLYERLHYAQPSNIVQLCRQMADKRPPDLLRDGKGFRLEGRLKKQFDAKYASRPATIAVDAMLQHLPGKVSDEAERLFLAEALTCLRSRAFRATIVMTWNLTYDHLLNWILANHLGAFNGAIPKRFSSPKKSGITISKKDDFSDQLKESEVIDLCGIAGMLADSTRKILSEKLTRRNLAAHPSLIEITQYQAEDVISDLVNNVILKLI